ncbi:hypothetical protein [Tautonia plasticadhaerens]|uniref:Uncharacterized protein n=1 Tax=Tautonia plasticadhaerens TaxID=2527974 RepID=A0A518H4X8_9BACT|nr:hypothetical protein [Tautonia plasticadhaerens]QDV35895.1 hypothetical protein ElP_38030 [Tautonia plasticadhaerens]
MRRRRLDVILFAVGLLVASAAVIVRLTPPLYEPFFAAREFDAPGWRAGDRLDRGRMTRDLESSGRLLGLDRGQVLDLLGPPDDRTEDSMSYSVDLGHRFGSTPWLYRLRVEFEGRGEVERVLLHD